MPGFLLPVKPPLKYGRKYWCYDTITHFSKNLKTVTTTAAAAAVTATAAAAIAAATVYTKNCVNSKNVLDF